MKKVFSNFLLSYFSLSAALLIILLVVSAYIYQVSKGISHNDGYSHLSTQMEVFSADLNRMSALISPTGNYNSIVKAAFLTPPFTPVDRYAMEQARKDLVNAVSVLSSGMIVDYGIVFQNGICITANRIFDSAAECFGAFLRFPGHEQGIWAVPAGFSRLGDFYTPEQKDFRGMILSGDMRLRYISYQSNKVFFIINMDLLFEKWLNRDITFVELYNHDRLIGSHGILDPGETYQTVEYSDKGYRGIAYIPNSVIWRKIKPAIMFIILSIAFFLITGLGLSLYFSNKHSRPLKKVVTRMMRQSNISSLPANEMLFIINSVERMGTDLERTQDILREQDRMLRTGMFERLLGGLIYTATEWEQARTMFDNLPETWCLCLIRGDHEKNQIAEAARSGAHLSAQFISEHLEERIIVHYIGDDGAVLVLPITPEYPDPETYEGIIGETAELMRTRHQLHISLAVSAVFGSIEQLAAAYRQARQLLRLAGSRQPRQNLFFMRDAETDMDRFPMEFTDSQRFYELLLAADFEHAALMIRHSFEYFRDRGVASESVIYHLFWSFEQVFVRFRAENITGSNSFFTLPVYNPQDSIEELTEKILASAEEVCSHIEKSKSRQEMELSSSVIAYINDNISNPMLNLSGVSSAFGLSDRYTQNLIRKAASKSFFEYVDQKRMKMAYSLLTESSISVNDIGIKCGFTLPNSFYKAFKRHFGFPPTDLRKNSS